MAGRSLAAALVLGFACTGAALAQQQRIVGDVVAAGPSTLTVRSTKGNTAELALPANARITARGRADWSQVKQGSYVGTTAVPQPDGTLLAKEVHVFTEAQRGTGEGHYPMSTPGDTMTNATVSSVAVAHPRDTMTNATVTGAAPGPAGGHRLTLTYKGGKQTVVVPDGVPIITSEPADRSLLVPGAHVVVYARPQSDGRMTVERVSVGKGGFAPPI